MRAFARLLPLTSIAFASQHVFDSLAGLPPELWNGTHLLKDETHGVPSSGDPVCYRASEKVSASAVPPPPSPPTPWTQFPRCIQTSSDGSNRYCVYTSSTFANNRGISIFTTPALAEHFAQSDAFKNPDVLRGVNDESNPPYIVQPLPGRGMGVIANRTLHRGDSLFSYSPVLIIHRKTFDVFSDDVRFPFQDEAVQRLPERARELFLSLHGHFGDDKVDDIIHTNSFEVSFGKTDESHNVVLPETSRMNHDCRPNAHYYFDLDTLTHHVHAIRTIQAGEEITISYTDGAVPRAERQAAIKRSWGFECSCSLCTQRETFTRESDRRLQLIADTQTKLDDWTQASVASPEMAEMLISLYEQERLHAPIAMAYTYAALAFNAVGNSMPALKYASLAIEMITLNSGPKFSDVQAMKNLMDDPTTHWSWKLRLRKK